MRTFHLSIIFALTAASLPCIAQDSRVEAPAAVGQIRDFPDTEARMLHPADLGAEFCLRRSTPEGVPYKIPVQEIVDSDAWATRKVIPMKDIAHPSSCPLSESNLQSMWITHGRFRGYRAHFLQNDVLWETSLKKMDGYLKGEAKKGCQYPDTRKCKAHEYLDVYIYLIDLGKRDPNDTRKLVFVDLFDLSLHETSLPACEEERHELALVPIAEEPNCPLPHWIPRFFSLGAGPEREETKETGTGGGYEPPPDE